MSLVAKAASTARFGGTTQSGAVPGMRGDGSVEPVYQPGMSRKVVYTAIWDDTVDGHIPAAGGLGLGVFIPIGFVVTEVSFDVEVIPVGPTNLSFSLNDDADLSAAAAINGAPWSTTGLKHGKNAGASAVEVAYTVQGPLVVTTAKEIQIVSTGAISSAGRVVIYVEGFQRPAVITQGA